MAETPEEVATRWRLEGKIDYRPDDVAREVWRQMEAERIAVISRWLTRADAEWDTMSEAEREIVEAYRREREARRSQ